MNNRTYGKCHSYSVVYFFMFFSLSAPKTRTIEFLDKNVRCERSFSVLLISFVLFIVASIAKSKEATIYIWKKNLLIFYSAACGGSCAANWPCATAFRKSIFTCHQIEPVSCMSVRVCVFAIRTCALWRSRFDYAFGWLRFIDAHPTSAKSIVQRRPKCARASDRANGKERDRERERFLTTGHTVHHRTWNVKFSGFWLINRYSTCCVVCVLVRCSQPFRIRWVPHKWIYF